MLGCGGIKDGQVVEVPALGSVVSVDSDERAVQHDRHVVQLLHAVLPDIYHRTRLDVDPVRVPVRVRVGEGI